MHQPNLVKQLKLRNRGKQMNFSFMSFSCPQLNLDEMIAIAKRYGYNGIEPRIDSGHKHGIELDSVQSSREKCRQKMEESGISPCCIATSCSYANPENNEEMVKTTHRAIDLAGDIGSYRIRVFGGAIPENSNREAAVDILVKSLNAVAGHAAERKVTICLETHDHWCNPKHVADVMKRVNHPAIAVNWDIMHPVRVAKVTIDEAFSSLKMWMKHVHFHDGITEEDDKLVMVPIGEGDIDHRRAVELLKTKGYDGFLSGEWINWESYETHLPRELSTMRKYESEVPRQN